jgi:tRNA-splicing ligase RtcB
MHWPNANRTAGKTAHVVIAVFDDWEAYAPSTLARAVSGIRSAPSVVRCPPPCGIAEEAPGADKDVHAVVDAAQAAGLATKVARLEPVICIKG